MKKPDVKEAFFGLKHVGCFLGLKNEVYTGAMLFLLLVAQIVLNSSDDIVEQSGLE